MTKKNLINILILLISFVSVLGININLDKDIAIQNSFDGNNFIYLILLVFYFKFVKYAICNKNEKRIVVISSIVSTLLTLFEIIGHSIYTYTDMSGIVGTKYAVIKNIIKAISVFCTLYCSMIFLFKNIGEKLKNNENVKAKKSSFFIYWGIIFVCYIPYFLTYYPGILSWDSLVQMQQGMGLQELTAHHPLLHTLIITLCTKLGLLIHDSYTLGAAIYSILQMLFMSATFAFAVYYMKKNNVNKYVVIISLLFFALYPVMPIYAITMWKDVPFALFMLLFVIGLIEITKNKERISSIKFDLLFSLCIFLVMMFRNNGIYVMYFAIPVVLLFNKKYWKRLLVIFIVPILVYKIINGPVISALGIQKGSIREALSVPLQQLARVEINKKDELTQEEYDLIHKFIKCDNIKGYYKTWLSDPIKENLDEEYFNENKIQFVKLWISLFFKYPNQYFEAFFDNSVGYWYPETDYMVVSRAVWHFDDGIIIKANPIIKGNIVRTIDSYIDRRDIPVVTLLFSIGFNVWVMFILLAYAIYKKKYRLLMVYIPMIALWLTVLASPLFAEYRYIYSLFTCMPVLFGFTIKNEIKEEV